MMRGASGNECGNLLGQEYNRPAEAGVLKKPREATLTFLTFYPATNHNIPEDVNPQVCVLLLLLFIYLFIH
jgi:hypothetical protein